jgi:hypothetical protein
MPVGIAIAAYGAYSSREAGKDAAKASKEAARTSADAQMAGLDYLKEREAIPQELREDSLTQLANIYGIGDDPNAAKSFVAGLKDNPLYKAILGTRGAGESAILRNASATGGLRSGNTSAQLTDYSQQLENQALLNTYNQQISGLGGLAQLPSMAPQIATGMAGIGNTLAQGQIAAAQAQQTGQQNMMNNLMGFGQLGIQAYQASDIRLKDNIEKTGEANGFNVYSWTWNQIAKAVFGLEGSASGVMADEVEAIRPDLIMVVDGYKTVNYSGVLHG